MLTGETVVLRSFREADFAVWYEFAQQVDVSLLALGAWRPMTVDTARRVWEGFTQAPPDERIYFAVEAQGAFIGVIGIKDLDLRSRHGWLAINIGAPGQHGRGYGRDAIRTLLRWAFEIQNLHRVSLDTFATNERALRCYRACGFVEEGRLREAMWIDGRFEDMIQMGLLRHEWLAAQGRA